MKNIKFKALQVEGIEALSREQLKKIMGGTFSCKVIGEPCMANYECCVNLCLFNPALGYAVCTPVS
jgi:hypothetical protein